MKEWINDMEKSLKEAGIIHIECTEQLICIHNILISPYDQVNVSEYDNIGELVESVKENGVIEPIRVNKTASAYELISGIRQYGAAMIAGLKEIPAYIVDIDQIEIENSD